MKRSIELPFFPSQSPAASQTFAPVHHQSPAELKIALFRRLFRGRPDVYSQRFQNRKTGKSGYQPACGNQWLRGICEKPKIRCMDCTNSRFLPVSDEVVRWHLSGKDPTGTHFVMGIAKQVDLFSQEEQWKQELEPYLHQRTEKFIKELQGFMRAKVSMKIYDERVQYGEEVEVQKQPIDVNSTLVEEHQEQQQDDDKLQPVVEQV